MPGVATKAVNPAKCVLTNSGPAYRYPPSHVTDHVRHLQGSAWFAAKFFIQDQVKTMKVRSSLKSLKGRHRDCKIVRRKGVVYVINKTDPRFKAKQG